MAKKKKVYEVKKGCDTADGTRYEIGDTYDSDLHSASTTKELLDSGAIEDGNS